MAFKKSDLKAGNQRIATAVEGLYNELPAYQVTLEDNRVGFFSKERFETEAQNWSEDTDGVLLLPAEYRLAKSGYWTPFARTAVGSSAFRLPGQ